MGFWGAMSASLLAAILSQHRFTSSLGYPDLFFKEKVWAIGCFKLVSKECKVELSAHVT